MPKYPYKPSCSLSKHTKRRREIQKPLQQVPINTKNTVTINHNSPKEYNTIISLHQNPDIPNSKCA